jgi:hypothetical protein
VITVPINMVPTGVNAMSIPIPARSRAAPMRIAVEITVIVMGRVTRPFAVPVAVAVIPVIPVIPVARFCGGRLEAGDKAEGKESK